MGRDALIYGSTFEGRYELISKLGEGGFGTVHKARQLTTGQLVAIKLMHRAEHGGPPIGDSRAARFLREIQLCAQLRHPNIVQIVDSGQTADGSLYAVFAFAPGDNLANVLAVEGALAPREARHFMLQVLDAIACAHAQGIVHRDLKPSNILISSTGARRNAVVLDFGISAILHGDLETRARLTASQEMLGTPGYLAPEQSRGADPSPAADIFSWGLVFIECLMGTRVYRGASAAEICYQLLGPDPVPLPPALARHPLGALLRRATDKDAARRGSSAPDLLRALEACELPEHLQGDWHAHAALADTAHDGVTSPLQTVPLDGHAPTVRFTTAHRRHLTVLCCQWRATGSARDAEAIDGAMRAALAIASDIVRRHRGSIVGALGRHLVAYFGYPNAEEDDARRAASAARAIAAAMRLEGERRAADGAAIEVRLGLHTGPVLLADRSSATARDTGIALGITPEVAVEVADHAAPGEILVSVESQRLLRGRFSLVPRGAVPCSGPGPAHEVYELGPERSDMTPVPGSDALHVALVGRDQEIGLLAERWRSACAGAGHACLITGEPGIGKSRLVRELRQRAAAAPHELIEIRCAPDTQHNALFPVAEALGRLLGLDRLSEAPARIRQLEAQLAERGVSPPDAMPLLLPLFALPFTETYPALDVSPQRHKALTLQTIVSLLLAVAEAQPLLVVVEDLHWSDATTLELLTLLIRDLTAAAMCVLMTTRPELPPTFSTSGMLQLHLTRLEPARVHELVAGLVGDKPLPPAVIEQVVNRTDGVPLFIEEMTRMMLESGWLLDRGDRFELSGQSSNLDVPSTLRALLTARLDRLGRAKETAQLAAALGREFRVDVLAAASPLGPVAVEHDLEQLMAVGLVLRKRRAKDPLAVFKHALVRDAAYDTLSRAARETVHARITATLEERFPEIVQGRPDLLAQHHAAAEHKVEASRYAQLAAHQALQRSAYEAAIAHASNVVSWSAAIEPRARVEVELAANGVLVQAMMAARGWADSQIKQTAQRSIELMHRLDGFSPHKVTVLWSLRAYYHTASLRPEARAVSEELVAIADGSGDRALQAAAYMVLGISLRPEGQFAAAARALERAIALYEPADHRELGSRFPLDALVLAKTMLAQLRWFADDRQQAFELITAGLRWARQTGHVPSLAMGLLYGCHVFQFAGDKQTTAEMAREILVLAEKYGLPAYEGYAAIMRAWAVGDHDRAEQVLQSLSKMNCKLGLSYYGSLVADNLAERGHHEAAIARIDHCLRLCADHGEHYYESELHRLRAVYALQRSPADAPAARAALACAVRLARAQGMRSTETRALDALHALEASRLMPAT